jgi:hypothetical protein
MSSDDAWIDEAFAEENARDARLKAIDDRYAKAAEEAKAQRLAHIAAIELVDPAKAARMRARAERFEAEKVGYVWTCSAALSIYADDLNGSWEPEGDPPKHDPPSCGEGGYADSDEDEED